MDEITTTLTFEIDTRQAVDQLNEFENTAKNVMERISERLNQFDFSANDLTDTGKPEPGTPVPSPQVGPDLSSEERAAAPVTAAGTPESRSQVLPQPKSDADSFPSPSRSSSPTVTTPTASPPRQEESRPAVLPVAAERQTAPTALPENRGPSNHVSYQSLTETPQPVRKEIEVTPTAPTRPLTIESGSPIPEPVRKNKSDPAEQDRPSDLTTTLIQSLRNSKETLVENRFSATPQRQESPTLPDRHSEQQPRTSQNQTLLSHTETIARYLKDLVNRSEDVWTVDVE